jgi:hypothetical protein
VATKPRIKRKPVAPASASKKPAHDALRNLKKHKCSKVGCKGLTVYMKRNRKTTEMDYWCGEHWKSEVEAKKPDEYRDQSKEVVLTEKGPRVRPRRRVKVKR